MHLDYRLLASTSYGPSLELWDTACLDEDADDEEGAGKVPEAEVNAKQYCYCSLALITHNTLHCVDFQLRKWVLQALRALYSTDSGEKLGRCQCGLAQGTEFSWATISCT